MKVLLWRLVFIVASMLLAGGGGAIAVFLCRVLRMGLSAQQGVAVVVIFSLFGLAAGVYSAAMFRPPQ